MALPVAYHTAQPATVDQLSPRNRAFLRRRQERPSPHRPLVADARPLNLTDKIEARRLRVLRQGWQEDAMNYADAVPELSFAYRFLQHCSARMRYYPAVVNPEEPGGPPIPAEDIPDLPAGLLDSMKAAMDSLGVGRLGVSLLQKSLSWNFGVPGEAYILGQEDGSGDQEWSIRSIDEFMVYEDAYKLREVPLDPQGTLGWINLDPDKTYAARLWVPHPRFRKLATSPMRSLIDVAEELLLLSRDVRATARSRLAGAGILKVPEGLRMMSFEGEGEDPMTDSWFGQFAELMMTPIADEGVASAVVPIAVSGEAEALAQLDHLVLDRPYSALAIELRAESIGRLATGLDVPREVLEGMSDPNHWGAWLVSDDTFRHHVEPQVIEQVDALTVGFFRQWLRADGHPDYWVDRACIWYDPVELITKPDPMANAIQLHDRFAISNRALRDAGGFDETDAPDALEIEFRMLQRTRSFPPNMVEAIFHAFDPALTFPPIAKSGEIPGISPTGEEVGPTEPPPPGQPPPTAGPPPEPPPTAGPAGSSAPEPTGGPNLAGMETRRPEPFAAAPTRPAVDLGPYQRLSRKLAQIDAMTRARIQTAATAHMIRLLDRAGARLRTKAKDKRFRAWGGWEKIQPADVTNSRVAAALGEQVVMALGYPDAHALLDADWSELRRQFEGWVRAAQAETVKTVRQLARLPADDARITRLAERLEAGVTPAWEALEAELNQRAADLLYHPAPTTGEAVIDPNTVVKAGTVRRALSIAGGGRPKATVTAADGAVWGSPDDPPASYMPTDASESPGSGSAYVTVQPPDGQIGTGPAVASMLDSIDNLGAQSFEWVHGPTMRPFEPHEALDGVFFSSWDDDVLAPPGAFPEVQFMFPGDHDGCSCDFTTIWAPTDDEQAATIDDTGADYSGFAGQWAINDNQAVQDAVTPGPRGYDDWETRRFDPRDLIAGQDAPLNQEAIAKWVRDGLPPIDPDEPPIVARINGNDVLLDGNNRAAAAIARGEEMEAKFVDVGDLPGLGAPAKAAAQEEKAAAVAEPDPAAARRNELQRLRRASRAAAEDEYGLARGDLDRIRDTLHPLFAEAQERISGQLERTGMFKIRAPERDAAGRYGGQYDFMDRLSPQERQRLATRWFVDDPNVGGPDEFAEGWAAATGTTIIGGADIDQAMGYWLDQTRAYDAAGSLLRGKIPDAAALGNYNIDTLLDSTASPYRPSLIFSDDAAAARHAAEVNAAEAEAVMDAQMPFARYGPNPWDMTEADWSAEVNALADIVDTATPVDTWEGQAVYGQDVIAAERRLDELLPPFVNELAAAHPEYSAADLHTAIVAQARLTGLIGAE